MTAVSTPPLPSNSPLLNGEGANSEGDSFEQRLQKADKLIKQGRIREALLVGEPLVAEAPHYVPLLRIVGIAALKCGEFQKAEKLLSTALKYDKKRGRALGAMADFYGKTENTAAEKRTLKELLSLQPSSGEDINFQIEAACRLNKHSLEKKLLKQALKKFPMDEKFSPIWTDRLSKLLQRRDLGWLQRKVAKKTAPPSFAALLVSLYLETGRAKEALDMLREQTGQLEGTNFWLPLYRRCSLLARVSSPFPFLFFDLLDSLPEDHYAYGEIGKRIARSPDFRSVTQPTPSWKVMQSRDHLLAAKLLGTADSDITAHLVDCCINLEDLDSAEKQLAPYKGTAVFDRAPYVRVRAKLMAKKGQIEDAIALLDNFLAGSSRDQYAIELLQELADAPRQIPSQQLECSNEEYLQKSFVHHRVSETVFKHLIQANAHYNFTTRANELAAFACSAFPQKTDHFQALIQN